MQQQPYRRNSPMRQPGPVLDAQLKGSAAGTTIHPLDAFRTGMKIGTKTRTHRKARKHRVPRAMR